MKNFLTIVAIIAVIGGAGYGVKWEIDEWNKKNNPQSVETNNKQETNVKDDTVEDDTTTEDSTGIDLSDFE